jgi:ABC-type sugar transport system substrate-binding protein
MKNLVRLLVVLSVVLVLVVPTAVAQERRSRSRLLTTPTRRLNSLFPSSRVPKMLPRCGVDMDIQYGNSDPVTQNNLIETAIANQVDGIAVMIQDDSAFDETICKQRKLALRSYR